MALRLALRSECGQGAGSQRFREPGSQGGNTDRLVTLTTGGPDHRPRHQTRKITLSLLLPNNLRMRS